MLAVLIVLGTVALVVWQPRGLGRRAATLGAVVALLAGVVHLSDLPTLWGATWNATLTLVGLIVLSLLLDAAGLFRWAALHVARWGAGVVGGCWRCWWGCARWWRRCSRTTVGC